MIIDLKEIIAEDEDTRRQFYKAACVKTLGTVLTPLRHALLAGGGPGDKDLYAAAEVDAILSVAASIHAALAGLPLQDPDALYEYVGAKVKAMLAVLDGGTP